MKKQKLDKRTKLEKEIDAVLGTMSTLSPDTKEYTAIVANLEKLYKLKIEEKNNGLKADTVAIVAGNILGIAMILGFEKANIITSKALGFVLKGRV